MSLDARQRAMLDEMGVKVWWPEAEAEAVAAEIATETIASLASGVGATARSGIEVPSAAPATARPIAAPAATADAGAGLWLEAQPQRLYAANAPSQGGWLIVADMPPGADGRHGAPFAGDAGRLLDNMLRALQLDRGPLPVHLLRLHRGAPATDGQSQPLAAGIAAQAEALAPRLVLALGPLAAQQLLGSAEPLGKLRGRVGALAARPDVMVVASYPPAYLLRNQADKARAWADLCLAAAQLG
jgi:DNA polymerase